MSTSKTTAKQVETSFTAKLLRLTEGRNKTALSRKAGLPTTAISDYLSKGHLPRLDHAAALAGVLGVSVDWLASGEADAPIPASAALPAERTDAAKELPIEPGSVKAEGAKLWRIEQDGQGGLAATLAVYCTIILPDGRKMKSYESVKLPLTPAVAVGQIVEAAGE